jgi:hypothetical protein
MSVGSKNRTDLAFEKAFVPALERIVRVTALVQPGGHHDFYTFARELPSALTWSWPQLAPPDLQRTFPLTASPPLIELAPIPQQPRAPVASCPTASAHREGGTRQTTPSARPAGACRA